MSSPALPLGNDFPDWLSPMLVKELRQGVRTRVFVSMFILLQVAMLVTVSLTLLVAANGGGTEVGTVFFWLVVGVPVLVVLPLNGLGAINGEIRANTLELTFLTRLTAFRIVAGKWLALFTQCLLFVCAVLPYLVLRYFIGGVNVTSELQVLGWMLVGSAVLSAAAVGLSAYPPRFVRGVAALACIALFFGFVTTMEMINRGRITSAGPDAATIIGALCCAAIVLGLMLEIGAARIAPVAENHSAVVRGLALAGAVVSWVANLFSTRAVGITLFAFGFAALICLLELCEPPRWVPRLFRPFALHGWPGRMVGRLFYPGWYTAVPFTLLIFAVFGGLLWQGRLLGSVGKSLWFVAGLGTLLLPVALVRLVFPGTKRAPLLYGVVYLLSLLVAVLALVCDNALGTAFQTPASFLPLAALVILVINNDATVDARCYAAAFTAGVSVALLLVPVLRAWRQARAAEIASLRPEATPPPSPAPHAPLA